MGGQRSKPVIFVILLIACGSLAAAEWRSSIVHLTARQDQFDEEPSERTSKVKPQVYTPTDTPEFYFTRLLYQQNGWRGTRTMPKPPQYTCPEFGGGNFFPPQGWGWATDYPGADCKFMGGVHRLTGLRVSPHPNI